MGWYRGFEKTRGNGINILSLQRPTLRKGIIWLPKHCWGRVSQGKKANYSSRYSKSSQAFELIIKIKEAKHAW